MATINNTGFFTLEAGEALEPNRRVKVNSSGKAVYADAADEWVGVTRESAASGANVAIKGRYAPGTQVMTSTASTGSVGDIVWAAADGKFASASSGAVGKVGYLSTAVTAASSEVEIYPVN